MNIMSPYYTRSDEMGKNRGLRAFYGRSGDDIER